MKKLSTGQDSTLGNYLLVTEKVFGKDSKAAKYLREKIEQEGWDSEVLADEGQMVYLLSTKEMEDLE
jgi:hypothetical protein